VILLLFAAPDTFKTKLSVRKSGKCRSGSSFPMSLLKKVDQRNFLASSEDKVSSNIFISNWFRPEE
jgi:hypothetical protein